MLRIPLGRASVRQTHTLFWENCSWRRIGMHVLRRPREDNSDQPAGVSSLKFHSIKRCNNHAKRYLQNSQRHATISLQKHISSFQCTALSDFHIISDILCFSFYFNSFKKSRRWRYDKEPDHKEAVYTNGSPADKKEE